MAPHIWPMCVLTRSDRGDAESARCNAAKHGRRGEPGRARQRTTYAFAMNGVETLNVDASNATGSVTLALTDPALTTLKVNNTGLASSTWHIGWQYQCGGFFRHHRRRGSTQGIDAAARRQ